MTQAPLGSERTAPQTVRHEVEPDRPWLDRIFLLRHLLETTVDRLFAGVALPAGCDLVLFNEADAGYGDISFATRLLHLLQAADPDLKLTLVSSSPQKQRIFGLPAGVTLHGFSDLEGRRPPRLEPTLVISAPGIFDHCRSRAQVLERLGVADTTPFLYLAEYGSIRQLREDAFGGLRPAIEARVETFLDEVADREGVGADEMGYRGRSGEVVAAIDGQMTSVDQLTRGLTRPEPANPLARWLASPVLQARSCGLETGELGVHIDTALWSSAQAQPAGRAPRRRALLTVLSDGETRRALREGGPEACLYMGYAASGLGLFCELVAAVERGGEGPIDVVVPNRRPAADILQGTFDLERCARLAGAGIGEVVVLGNPAADTAEADGGQDQGVHRRRLGSGRRLRLLTHHPIPHPDFRALMVAAEPITMVTGDQSFSEAVSAGKAIALMEPVYCKTFHMDSILALAETVDAALADTLRMGMQAVRDEAQWQRAVAFACSGGLQRAGQALSTRVREDHNASGPLMQAITRRLWTQRRPALADACREVMERAWTRLDATDTISLNPQDLEPLRALVATLTRRPGAAGDTRGEAATVIVDTAGPDPHSEASPSPPE